MTTTTISRANLAMAECASKDDSRHALMHLLIEPDGSTVATDGRILAVCQAVPSKNYDAAARLPTLVSPEMVEAARNMLPSRKREDVELSVTANCDRVAVEVTCRPLEGDGGLRRTAAKDCVNAVGAYPAYRKVLPPASASAFARFSITVHYLEKMVKMMKAAGVAGKDCLTFDVRPSRGPVVVRAEVEQQSIFSVVMPADGDIQPSELELSLRAMGGVDRAEVSDNA